MFFVLSAVMGLFMVWFCFSALLFLLGLAGLIAYFITKAVFKHKGKNKPKAVWFILPTVFLVLGLVSMLAIVLLCVVLQVSTP